VGADRDWVAGKITLPVFVTEGDPYRPEAFLWIELPEGLIVHQDLVDPAEPVSFAESLRRALERPIAGEPRRPATIRVEDPALAEEIRAAHPGIRVVVGPTPEVDDVARAMAESFGTEEPSYFENRAVAPDVVARLFLKAEILRFAEPWRTAADAEIRVDVPALDVDGACLRVIGSLGEARGFLLFPSLAAYTAYTALPTEAARTKAGRRGRRPPEGVRERRGPTAGGGAVRRREASAGPQLGELVDRTRGGLRPPGAATAARRRSSPGHEPSRPSCRPSTRAK
jgi:hypothetical protein